MRKRCVDSIKTVIDSINSAMNNNLLDAVNICVSLLVDLGVVRNDNINNVINDLTNLANGNINLNGIFTGLFNNPDIFILKRMFQCTNGDLINIANTVEAMNTVSALINILNIHESALRASIDALRFRLVFDPRAQDQYVPADNTIIITGNLDSYNLVTGPVLSNGLEHTHVETQWKQVPAPSALKHELGHYLRIGLENMVGDPAFLNVGPVLFNNGLLSSEYIIHLADIWDDAEELTEIFGIICVGGALFHDRLNQSDFNLEADLNHVNGVRYSHRNSRFPLIPYKIFNSVFGINGLPIANRSVVFYDKTIATI